MAYTLVNIYKGGISPSAINTVNKGGTTYTILKIYKSGVEYTL